MRRSIIFGLILAMGLVADYGSSFGLTFVGKPGRRSTD
jgi:hypothetical protein